MQQQNTNNQVSDLPPTGGTRGALKFSTNWNKKLDCDVFSTIRLWNPAVHYVGREVSIYDNSGSTGKFKGRGRYELVSEIKLHQLKPAAAILDTGYPLPETLNLIRAMYRNKIADVDKASFAYIIVRKIKDEPKQNTLQL